MEVTYTLGMEDFVAGGLHRYKQSPVMKGQFVLGWILPPLLCLYETVQVASFRPDKAVTFAIVGGVYAVVYPFVYRAWLRWYIRAYARGQGAQGAIGRITLTLTEESLIEQTESVRSEARWRDMRGAEVVGDRTYIYITGMLMAILPRHGFDREEEYEAVKDFVLRKLGG